MTLGTSSQAYGEPWYWDNRYSNESGTFDWYQKYSSLSPLINLYIPPHSRARFLVVGCGNSAFSEGLVGDGYEDVVNIDISSVVIEAMQKKYFNHPHLKYLKMDVRDMSAFQAASFDAVVDKGTLDSILCGTNSQQNATRMLEEVWRVLKDKGVYILITYGAPVYRLRLLRESCLWKMKLHVIDKFISEGTCENSLWQLTHPLPLDDNGSSVESVLGKNPDVHYIYICIKILKPHSFIFLHLGRVSETKFKGPNGSQLRNGDVFTNLPRVLLMQDENNPNYYVEGLVVAFSFRSFVFMY